ncbi:MAG: phosphatase PAP2 family protein [Lachnospiraceae bacterium]|jgi:membrane-associated phospholipid phosphatase|nr:phosphatase PAP2 family protein [Lachnospiraceae bacterium]
MKELYQKYKHAWLMIGYLVIYLVWFFALEARTDIIYHPVHTALDDLIPFCEAFIIPYNIWFAYISLTVLYFFFTDKEDYYRTCAILFIGMTVCLIIYTIWPNMQRLRPMTLPRTNIFTKMVVALYGVDTPTNVCPSIHVYNSIVAHLAIKQSNRLKGNKVIGLVSGIICVSICASTVFLKQHSVFDGFCGVVLAGVMYLLVYVPDYKGAYELRHREKEEKRVY